jgi:hypothetical protein
MGSDSSRRHVDWHFAKEFEARRIDRRDIGNVQFEFRIALRVVTQRAVTLLRSSSTYWRLISPSNLSVIRPSADVREIRGMRHVTARHCAFRTPLVEVEQPDSAPFRLLYRQRRCLGARLGRETYWSRTEVFVVSD